MDYKECRDAIWKAAVEVKRAVENARSKNLAISFEIEPLMNDDGDREYFLGEFDIEILDAFEDVPDGAIKACRESVLSALKELICLLDEADKAHMSFDISGVNGLDISYVDVVCTPSSVK